MNKEEFSRILQHEIPIECQWVLFERIRIATAVLPV